MTAEEVERIRAEMPSIRDAAIVSLGAYAGCGRRRYSR